MLQGQIEETGSFKQVSTSGLFTELLRETEDPSKDKESEDDEESYETISIASAPRSPVRQVTTFNHTF